MSFTTKILLILALIFFINCSPENFKLNNNPIYKESLASLDNKNNFSNLRKLKNHEEITLELITLIDSNAYLKTQLEKSISKAKQKNPHKLTNPCQTLEEYYDFIDFASKAYPWNVLQKMPYSTQYDNMLQGQMYFYFVTDQPLEELEDMGFYRNSLQYQEPYRSWLIKFSKTWGLFLASEESWSEEFYQLIKQDDSFGLKTNWYEDHSNWKTFNDFFSRKLSSKNQRPILYPNDDSIVNTPCDSMSRGIWHIDHNSNVILNDQKHLLVKSVKFRSIPELLGNLPSYKDSFKNGTQTHMYLDVNDYHRQHFPIDGKIQYLGILPDGDFLGGVQDWIEKSQKYIFTDFYGWQHVQTRGIVVIDTQKYGLVSVVLVGMSQVSSVNFEKHLKVGDFVKKGDPLGYFQFGGSDCMLIFQDKVNFSQLVPKKTHDFIFDHNQYEHSLMGEKYGKIQLKDIVQNLKEY